MRRYFIFVLAFMVIIFPAGCSNQEKAAQERIKPVKTIEIKEQESPIVLNYSGIVGSGELKQLAFKSTGRIASINVEEGQSIKKGDVLVELESQDLQYALAAAKGQMGAVQSAYEKAVNGAAPEELRNAELNVKKAQDAFDYVMNNYTRTEALYKSGAVSKNGLEQAKLEADVKESELKQAVELLNQVKNGVRSEDKQTLLEQLDQAKADYEYKASLVKDAAMTSDMDGCVVDILYEKGELVPAGHPVAVVRSKSVVVKVGLSEKDLGRVMPGTKAKVSVGGNTTDGIVTGIAQMPDAQTRTYEVEISIEEDSQTLGAITKVEIISGNETGIWVPLTSMLSDGMDYVYLVKDNIAEKREIMIEAIVGSRAKVKGLEPGEQLVVEGMKRLRAGDAISVLK